MIKCGSRIIRNYIKKGEPFYFEIEGLTSYQLGVCADAIVALGAKLYEKIYSYDHRPCISKLSEPTEINEWEFFGVDYENDLIFHSGDNRCYLRPYEVKEPITFAELSLGLFGHRGDLCVKYKSISLNKEGPE